MNQTEVDVLIVGAGPVGLTLGCELIRRGLSCRLIDALPQPVVYSKAAVVHARTMEVLDTLGVADALIRRSKLIHGMSSFSQGKRVTHILFDEIESPFPHVYGISQHDTEAVLSQRFQQLGGTIERALRLDSLVQDDEGVTAVLLGADGQPEQVRTRWLCGCDGAHSTVRHQLKLAFEGAPYEERIVQTDARVEWPQRIEDDEILLFLAPDGPVACFPFFQDGRYRVLKVYTGEAPRTEPTLETFQRMLDEVIPGARIFDPSWIIGFSIHHRLAEHYRVGRVFLTGDAAHIHSPAGGQGMNTGIQDAHNLAWKLAAVHRGVAYASLLDSYEAERRPIAAELLRGTDLATRAVVQAVKLRSPLALGLRNALMEMISRLDFVRENATKTLSMLERHYRGSAIVAEHHQPLWRAQVISNSDSERPSLLAWSAFLAGPHPGDRAPDVVIKSEDGSHPLHLHKLLSTTQHTLLLFDGEASTAAGYQNLADIARRVRERCGDNVVSHLIVPAEQAPASIIWEGSIVTDAEKKLHARYGARAECLYLIRPDGHIAYRSQPAEWEPLLAYLHTVFTPR